jgi:hypothetical protein
MEGEPRDYSKFSLYEIAFIGDGNFDLLTNLYSPKYLYSHLEREIYFASRAEHNGDQYPIGIITLRFPPEQFSAAIDKKHFENWTVKVKNFHLLNQRNADFPGKNFNAFAHRDGRVNRGDLPILRREAFNYLQLSSYERELIAHAKSLERNLREGDTLARLYETGFLVTSRSSLAEMENAVKRLSTLLPKGVQFKVLERNFGEDLMQLLDRIDKIYFTF